MSKQLYGKHNPNPLHHNYGRAQSLKARFASRITFLNFTLRGLSGNLNSAIAGINQTPGKIYLELEDQIKLLNLLERAAHLRSELQELQSEVAEFNVTKTWVD
jgi:hypothetical protein